MPFIFRYQKVLDVREKQQHALEVELARIERAVLDARADLARWNERRQDVLAQLRSAREGGDIEQNAYGTAYLRHLRRRRAQSRQALTDVERQRDAARASLADALKACKVLEKYREKLEAEHLVAVERTEEQTVELHSARAHVRAGEMP